MRSGRALLGGVWSAAVVLLPALAAPPSVRAACQLDFDAPPISYTTAEVHDRVTELQARLDAGEATLAFDERHGYLPAVLEAFEVPVSSQVLVFSKTSFQLHKIDPSHPRALYFRDDVYLGWVQDGDVVEVVAVDPVQGPIFYTLAQRPVEHPTFVRDRGECLTCHATSRTESVPGLLVRSVFPDETGRPILGSGSFTIDHRSALSERWGGWYVTGTHGAQRHMGNGLADRERMERGRPAMDREAGANHTDLTGLVDVSPYLQPTSDLVALMVLEHQTRMQNLITRAGFEARSALAYDRTMNEALGRPLDTVSESTGRRITKAVDQLLKYALFTDEEPLTEPLRGVSAFAADYQAAGVRDSKGRSLRDLDLGQRMFRHPLSSLILSPAFDALPPLVLTECYERLRIILAGEDADPAFAKLPLADRTAIREILKETKAGLPGGF